MKFSSTIYIQSKRFDIDLTNTSDTTVKDIKLCFTLPIANVSNVEGAEVYKTFGSYVEFSPLKKTLSPSEIWHFSFNAEVVNHISDAPQNPFLVCNHDTEEEYILSLETLTPIIKDFDTSLLRDAKHRLSPRALDDVSETKDLSILPYPAYVEYHHSPQKYLNITAGLLHAFSDDTLPVQREIHKKGIEAFKSMMTTLQLDTFFSPSENTSGNTSENTQNNTPTTSLETCALRKNARLHQSSTYYPYFSETKKDIRVHGEEAYVLDIQTNSISIKANSSTGILYACISLYQLWHTNKNKIPCCIIEDMPRFEWRGFMLDTVRQYYTPNRIMEILSLLTLHKINMFHWHFSDDEAWRIELESYPNLTQWAYRGYKEKLPPLFGSPHTPYGGVYTHEDIKTIVDYAQMIGITIVPEFDIPGHSTILFQAIPSLHEENDHSTYSSMQGYFSNTLNPGLDSTYEVIENIVNELCSLFPSPYFHYGYDEIPEGAWKHSPECKALMKNHSIDSVDALQVHFIENIENTIRAKKQKLCTWEESFTYGGADKDTIVFSWKGIEAGIAAIQSDHIVVMCPADYYYLDMAQSPDPYDRGASWKGYAKLQDVYQYEPIPEGLFEELKLGKGRIIGVQATAWGENFHTKASFDYLVFPRLAAIAESAWSMPHHKNYERFINTLQTSYCNILKDLDIQYCDYL